MACVGLHYIKVNQVSDVSPDLPDPARALRPQW